MRVLIRTPATTELVVMRAGAVLGQRKFLELDSKLFVAENFSAVDLKRSRVSNPN